MVNFPHDDLLFDILSRIPVKSVLQFRCVCKSWCSLISKPEFVKTQLNRAITDVNIGCQRVLISSRNKPLISIDYEALQLLSEKEIKKALRNNGGNACSTVLDFPWSGLTRRVRLVGTCHGMVALLVDLDKIVICNPCTREYRELPKPTSIIINYGIHGGLGYDSYGDDYKFVIALRDESDGQFKAAVFSLRSNSWRIIQDIPGDISYISGFEQGPYLNGALHWIAYCKTHGRQIISFDLATEKFQKLLPLPPCRGDKRSSNIDYSNLIILGGCLSVSNRFPRETNVWVMKDYGVKASWTKFCTLDNRLYEAPMRHYLTPVCLSKNGELLVDVDVDDKFIVYYQPDQNYRTLYNSCGSDWLFNCLSTQYIESLVSPNVR